MDFRVDADFLEHPKTLHLLELAGADGVVWLLRLWAFTTKHRPSGELCGMSAARIEAVLHFPYESIDNAENPGLDRVKTLVESGWLVLNEGTKTYLVSGWDEYQKWVVGAKERSESAKKAAKSRWDNRDKHNAPRIQSAMHPARQSHNAVVDAPSPSPSPTPNSNILSGKPEIEYEKIVEDLNKKTGQSYKHTSKVTREKIRARVNDGFTVEDFLTVNSKKAAEWMGTEMQKFLRPETLYGTKFEGYLNQKTTIGKTKDQIEFEQSLAESQRRVENTRKEMELTYGTTKVV